MESLVTLRTYIPDCKLFRFNDFSIDEAINLVRSRYVYKHSNPDYNIAAQEYIKKQNIVLCRGIRRCWFSIQYALYEVKNDK